MVYYLDTDEHVITFVKNANLGFRIPYLYQGRSREYLPDFLVRLRWKGREVGTLILETKGYDPVTHVKVAAAHRWVAAVNADGRHGRWTYRLVTSPSIAPSALRSAARELAEPPRSDWRKAVEEFTSRVRTEYGPRLRQVVLYGSRARGDSEDHSDVDLLIVLDRIADARAERERLRAIATGISLDSGAVISVFPVEAHDFETSRLPVVASARREGKVIG